MKTEETLRLMNLISEEYSNENKMKKNSYDKTIQKYSVNENERWQSKQFKASPALQKRLEKFKSVTELKKELARAQKEFNDYSSAIEGKIEMLRVKKTPDYYAKKAEKSKNDKYFDRGRDREPTHGMGGY